MFCQEYWAERGMKTASRASTTSTARTARWDGGREKAPAAICRKVIDAVEREQRSHRHLGRRHADAQLHVHRRLHRAASTASPTARRSSPRRSISARASWSRSTTWSSIVEEIAGVKLEREYDLERPTRRRRPQQRQHLHQEDARLGAEHHLGRRSRRDVPLDPDAISSPTPAEGCGPSRRQIRQPTAKGRSASTLSSKMVRRRARRLSN